MTQVQAVAARLEQAKLAKIKQSIHREQLAKLGEALEKSRADLTEAEKARELLNALVNHKKRTTLDKIESLVTFGLQTIFENPNYAFKVNTSIVRKQVAYTFTLSEGGHDSENITETRGGGVVNVVSFLLALVVQLMLDPKARFFILDEKFANVSSMFVPNIADLLATLAKRMNVQFLQVSHQDALTESSDVVYNVQKGADGVARMTKR